MQDCIVELNKEEVIVGHLVGGLLIGITFGYAKRYTSVSTKLPVTIPSKLFLHRNLSQKFPTEKLIIIWGSSLRSYDKLRASCG